MDSKTKIKPLIYYLNDKEEMINQIFSCINEKQIKNMTPIILKDMSVDELKAECLVQLLQISDKSVINILEGRKCHVEEAENTDNLHQTVSMKRTTSETNDENVENLRTERENSVVQSIKLEYDTNLIKTSIKLKRDIQSNKSPIGAEHISNNPAEITEKSEKTVDLIKNLDSTGRDLKLSLKKKHKEKKHKSGKKKKRRSEEAEKKNNEDTKGKNLLELLELEMRAKAIRSLLKKEEELEKLQAVKKEDVIRDKTEIEVQVKEDKKRSSKLKGNIRNKEEKNHKGKNDAKEGDKISLVNIVGQKRMHTPSFREGIEEEIEGKTELCLKTNEQVKKKKYDWTEDDDKLIYEDDNYESDEEKQEIEEREEQNSGRSCWAKRWLQSKDVKKVVATSKMLTVVRNKMKNKALREMSTSKHTDQTSSASVQFVENVNGVKEYDTLLEMHEAVSHGKDWSK